MAQALDHCIYYHLTWYFMYWFKKIETECTVMLFLLLTSEHMRIMEKVIVPQPWHELLEVIWGQYLTFELLVP